MKKVISISVLFILVVLTWTANAEIYESNTFLNAKLLKIDYYEAIIDVEFYLADNRDKAYLIIDAEQMSRGMYFNHINHGFNKIKVAVQRDNNKNSQLTTKKIKLLAFEEMSNPFWMHEIELEINWPGPEFVKDIIGDARVDYYDYSSINTINIVRHAYNSKVIYEDILRAGVPIYKARRYGMLVVPSDNTKLAVKIGRDVEAHAAKKLISSLLEKGHDIVDVSVGSMDEKMYFDNDILIKPVKEAKLSPSTLDMLKQNKISDEDFYALLGAEKPTSEDYIERQYKVAYDLIDLAGKGNLSRAKNILDEIISRDPNYVNAYVEVARYKMKVLGGTPESFYAAEKTLLIAKDIDANHADVRVLLGYVYTNQNRFEDAENEYREAEKIGTDNSWLYANWGLNDEKQSNVDEAINHYMRVIEKPRRFDRNDRVMKWVKVRLFPLLEKRERYNEADKYYARYVKDFPEDSCLLLSQAENRLNNFGDYDAAIELNILAGRKGCTNKSDSLSVAYFLKWFSNENKKLKSATLRQAEAMAPDDALLLYSLAKSEYTSPIINQLVKKGRNINAEDVEGLTALLLAIYLGDQDAMKRLVKAGADINGISTIIKVSPLGLAVLKENADMVKFLIDNKADTTVVLPNGVSAYEWAKSSGREDISRLLGNKQSI